jgi:hypothetical protein
MNIEINPAEIINEMQEKFSKEFTICVQAVQIRKMGELLEGEVSPGADEETKKAPEKSSER